jgi:hypothetical protein
MLRMLCRNKVADFSKWKAVFDSHASAHKQAGLLRENLWRELEDANNVFFIFRVEDLAKARAFISSPDAATAGKASGVIEGNYWFLNDD